MDTLAEITFDEIKKPDLENVSPEDRNKILEELSKKMDDRVSDIVNFFRENPTWDKEVKIIFEFTSPVELRYGTKYGNTKTKTKHTVKNIFETRSKSGLYYVAGRMRNRGFMFDYENYKKVRSIKIISNNVEKDYSKEWANIAKSLRKYNINLSVAKAIEDYLKGDAEYIKGFQNYYTKENKPKRMSFKDVLDFSNTDMDRMKESAKASTDKYSSSHAMKPAKNPWSKRGRDRSVTMRYLEDESYMYYSASEYPNCGNGDYYCMYSPTMAFYMETD